MRRRLILIPLLPIIAAMVVLVGANTPAYATSPGHNGLIICAALALDDDWPDVLAALRAGIREGKPAERARAGIAYVQLVYGRQLQQAEDEQPTASDPLDIASMTREQRDKLKRRLLTQHPPPRRRARLAHRLAPGAQTSDCPTVLTRSRPGLPGLPMAASPVPPQ